MTSVVLLFDVYFLISTLLVAVSHGRESAFCCQIIHVDQPQGRHGHHECKYLSQMERPDLSFRSKDAATLHPRPYGAIFVFPMSTDTIIGWFVSPLKLQTGSG